jgi:hypothetical protein
MEKYVCSICEAKFDNEMLVRTHISLSEHYGHKNKTGFSPADSVSVINENNEIVDRINGKGNPEAANLLKSEVPDELDRVDAVIIKTAVNSNTVDSSELIRLTNAALDDAGLAIEPTDSALHRGETDVPSSVIILKKLNDFFELSRTEGAKFEELTKLKQRILKAYAKDTSIGVSELAKETNVSPSYCALIVERYGDIIERVTSDEMDKYLDEISSGSKIIIHDGGKLTDKKADSVEYLARNLNATNQEVAEAVGCSASYPSAVRDEYKDLIDSLATSYDSELA